jgi:hypothetical protein
LTRPQPGDGSVDDHAGSERVTSTGRFPDHQSGWKKDLAPRLGRGASGHPVEEDLRSDLADLGRGKRHGREWHFEERRIVDVVVTDDAEVIRDANAALEEFMDNADCEPVRRRTRGGAW